MAFLNGKWARFSATTTSVAGSSSGNVTGAYKWAIGFKRDRLDTTNFESSADTINVFSEGLVGVLDTTFSVDGYVSDTNVNIFWPGSSLAAGLYYRKTSQLGYTISNADLLDFSPTTTVRDKAGFSAQFQTNGTVNPAS